MPFMRALSKSFGVAKVSISFVILLIAGSGECGGSSYLDILLTDVLGSSPFEAEPCMSFFFDVVMWLLGFMN